MDVWVTLRDGAASAEVVGAYATSTEAEAAAFRRSQTPESYGSLEVLKFEMDTFSLQSEKQRQLDLIHELRKVADTQERRAELAESQLRDVRRLFDGNDFTYGGYRYTCEALDA